jgi:hypothetical protein
VLALRAGRVLRIETVPGQRATGVGVVERIDVNGAIRGARQQRGTVKA